MAGTFNIKQNDLLPSIIETLTLGGVPINLSSATSVRFHMKATQGGGSPKIDALATVVNAAGGVVQYDWTGTDTDTVGSYDREWQITFPGPKQLTVPNDQVGYPVVITDDII